MAIYQDIKITGDDLDMVGVQARIITDRDVILQDLRHALRESGLLVALVGERSAAQIKLIHQKIILLAEEDWRIIPGSMTITMIPNGCLLTGKTYDFGNFTERITIRYDQ